MEFKSTLSYMYVDAQSLTRVRTVHNIVQWLHHGSRLVRRNDDAAAAAVSAGVRLVGGRSMASCWSLLFRWRASRKSNKQQRSQRQQQQQQRKNTVGASSRSSSVVINDNDDDCTPCIIFCFFSTTIVGRGAGGGANPAGHRQPRQQ